MAYVTAAQLRAYLRISSTDDDALLGSAAAQAQRYIEAKTSRVFEASADTTRKFTPVMSWNNGDLTDSRTLSFDDDLCALTSITNGDGSSISLSDVELLPLNRRPAYAVTLISDTVAWTYSGSSPVGKVLITGKWAYSLTAPQDIYEATLQLAEHLYKSPDASAYTQAVMSTDGVPLIPPGIPARVNKVIATYARRVS
jgi:hypothetical protein